MGKNRILIAAAILVLLSTLGCGGGSSSGSSSRQLQSITANVTGGLTQFQFTATGGFSASPKSVTPLPVAWYINPGVLDPPPPSVEYTLTSQTFSASCQTGTTVIAIAPQSPTAPTTGTIPGQVWMDLAVKHTTTSEGGFVASLPQNILCP